MGISCSGVTSFTPTPSYLTGTDGRPMSMTFHAPQQIPTSLPSGNDALPSKSFLRSKALLRSKFFIRSKSSLFRPRKRKRVPPTDRIPTTSHQSGGENLPHTRSQDSNHEEPSHTPSSFSDIPTGPPPHSQPSSSLRTPPHPYRRKGGSSQRARSRSVDALSHPGSSLPEPHRITRVASTTSLDGRRPPRPNVEPVPSQDDLRLAPLTTQIQAPADTRDDPQCLESTFRSILDDDSRYSVGHCPIVITNATVHRFNILVLGEVCDDCMTSLSQS